MICSGSLYGRASVNEVLEHIVLFSAEKYTSQGDRVYNPTSLLSNLRLAVCIDMSHVESVSLLIIDRGWSWMVILLFHGIQIVTVHSNHWFPSPITSRCEVKQPVRRGTKPNRNCSSADLRAAQQLAKWMLPNLWSEHPNHFNQQKPSQQLDVFLRARFLHDFGDRAP